VTINENRITAKFDIDDGICSSLSLIINKDGTNKLKCGRNIISEWDSIVLHKQSAYYGDSYRHDYKKPTLTELRVIDSTPEYFIIEKETHLKLGSTGSDGVLVEQYKFNSDGIKWSYKYSAENDRNHMVVLRMERFEEKYGYSFYPDDPYGNLVRQIGNEYYYGDKSGDLIIDPEITIGEWTVNLKKMINNSLVYWNTTEPTYNSSILNYTCLPALGDCAEDCFEYTTSPKYAKCLDRTWEESNSTWSYDVVFAHSWDTADLPSKTMFWDEFVQNGTEIVEHNRTLNTPLNKVNMTMTKLDTEIQWICDYSAWGNCGLDLEAKQAVCDSKYDGNADGKCDSGERCIYIDLSREGLKQLKNFSNPSLNNYMIECELQ